MACENDTADFKPMRFKRRAVTETDVLVEMKFCGICHTDLHFALNDLGMSKYPVCPGHELAGVCVGVGSKVKNFKVGDHVGIGCMVDSCQTCTHCKAGNEQYCVTGSTFTYAATDQYGRAASPTPTGQTYGGYSSLMVVTETFAIKLDKSFPLEMAGPIMCAGVTMYDPLKHWGVKKGTRVGIVGLGGLGMMGVQIAKAMGAVVTVISRSKAKEAHAKGLGADSFIAMADEDSVTGGLKTLDLILNTIAVPHAVAAYLGFLDTDGTIVQLGVVGAPHEICQLPLVFGRNAIAGSVIGGIKNTQEVMDLCAKSKIYPKVEVIPVAKINDVFTKLASGNDAGIRYVIDIGNTLTEAAFTECTAPPPDLSGIKPPAPKPTLMAAMPPMPVLAGAGAAMVLALGIAIGRGLRA